MVNRRYSEYAASDSDTSKSTKFNSSSHDNCAKKMPENMLVSYYFELIQSTFSS